MGEKIRVVCGECDKKLACPASAAGKKVKCTSCGAAIRVPATGTHSSDQRAAAKTAARKKRRQPAAPADAFDDPYEAPTATSSQGMPPRGKKRKDKSSGKKKSRKSAGRDRHWSRKISIGFAIMGVTVFSSSVQTMVMGAPNMSTNEGKGRAAGQGLVLVCGLIFGLVVVIRGFMANKSEK